MQVLLILLLITMHNSSESKEVIDLKLWNERPSVWEEVLPGNGKSGSSVVQVYSNNGKWFIKGKKHEVVFNESDFSLTVNVYTTSWSMLPSQENDIVIKSQGKEVYVRLSDAGKRQVEYFDAGYKTGIKIVLSDWDKLNLKLYLTLCLEGKDEDLAFHVSAEEGQATIRQLNWPTALNPEDIDYTFLSNMRGVLLPRDWPRPYHPIRTYERHLSITPTDRSEVQSNMIENWSMSWWGFQKGKSALIVIVETPDDAAYKFSHPAGGPTVICPHWLSSLGKSSYPLSIRMSFIENGNYVDMSKRYRKYVMDIGQFVSLKEKIAREPMVEKLIGTPHLRQHILRNYKPESRRYDIVNKANNYRLITFDERAQQLRNLKSKGIERVFVTLAGWTYLGYDRQHPDVMSPSPEAGADWVIPYVDYTSGANAGSCIPAPLYTLVYHDAVMTPEGGNRDYLRCLLNGGDPSVPGDITNEKDMGIMRTISTLHKKVALQEMTNYEFLDKDYRKERSTFLDGTTVTIDKDTGTFEILPELKY